MILPQSVDLIGDFSPRLLLGFSRDTLIKLLYRRDGRLSVCHQHSICCQILFLNPRTHSSDTPTHTLTQEDVSVPLHRLQQQLDLGEGEPRFGSRGSSGSAQSELLIVVAPRGRHGCDSSSSDGLLTAGVLSRLPPGRPDPPASLLKSRLQSDCERPARSETRRKIEDGGQVRV